MIRYKTIAYGPILSRRMGRSLGINILGTNTKICNFNCIYCELGKTQKEEVNYQNDIFPSVDCVIKSLEYSLRKPYTLDHLTFSGNGEPTLHPNFSEIIHHTRKLRDKYKPSTKIAVLSNSYWKYAEETVKALNLVDKPVLKLDCSKQNDFMHVNRPLWKLKLSKVLKNIKQIKNFVIQTLLFKGECSNANKENLDKLTEMYTLIRPMEIQLYTIARQTSEAGLIPLAQSELATIAANIHHQTGLDISCY